MPQSKILVDTNSYFRLAKSIHPLLFVEFGDANHCLYIIPELDKEFGRSPSLQTKFSWALDPEYVANRRVHPNLSRKQQNDVKYAQEFLWDHVQSELPGPSRIDTIYLSYGFVLKIPVVTDDKDMRALAEVFDIKTLVTIELMRLMVDCNHITRKKIDEMCGYWRYWKDMPYNLDSDMERLFGDQ
jgi:hypothetical protein